MKKTFLIAGALLCAFQLSAQPKLSADNVTLTRYSKP